MAGLFGFHFWIIVVSSAILFSEAGAAASHNQDIFDLFIKEPTPRPATTAKPIRKARSESQDWHMRGGGNVAPIFGLFIPYRVPPDQLQRTTPTRAQAPAPAAKSFAAPQVKSKRTQFTPKLAAIVKPKPTIPRPKNAVPAPQPKPDKASLVTLTPRPVPGSKQRPRKFDCDQARAIIGKYAFDNVQAKSCEGDVYSFATTRSGKPFLVKISALSGELVEVKRDLD